MFRIFTLLGLLSVQPAFAADILKGGDDSLGCDLTLQGTITSGDAAKARDAILEHNVLVADELGEPIESISARICLESPGGTFSEGIQLARVFKETLTTTVVAQNRTCASACAIAFLGGTVNTFGADFGHDSMTNRLIHPTARLGFHAPSLIVQDGTYTAETVGLAYAIARKGIAGLQDLKNEIYISDPLMSAILNTPPEEMTYLETVGQSAQWNINVVPTIAPTHLTVGLVETLCNNMNMAAPSVTGGALRTSPKLRPDNIDVVDADPGNDYVFVEVNQSYRYPGNVFCSFGWSPVTADSSSVATLSGTLEVFMRAPYAWAFDPDTPIRALARQNDARPEGMRLSDINARAQAQCYVLRDAEFRDTEPCTVERTMVEGTEAFTFIWPSGARTVVERNITGSKINGSKTLEENAMYSSTMPYQAVSTLMDIAENRDISMYSWRCWLNASSGNRFCAMDTETEGAVFN